MKKILITGKEGQIGWELCRTMAPLGYVQAFGKEELDLANPDAIRKLLRSYKPDIILNAAGYTYVEKAENQKDIALLINKIAPAVLAEEAKQLNAILVHYSTDYVFDGASRQPYRETDPPHPLNFYGQSKLEGEKAIESIGGHFLILRTSWVYGMRGKNFLLNMLKLAKEKEELKVVDDQVGSPTWSRWIAEATALILAQRKEKWGTYHLSCSGETSWYNFAKEIFHLTSSGSPQLIPISTQQYLSSIQRPRYSVLSNEKIDKAFGITLPHWQTALTLCLEQTKKQTG